MHTTNRMRKSWPGFSGLAIVVGLAAGTAPVPVVGAADSGARPTLSVADASQGCPSVSGSFVALLDPGRGMLLLSGAPFPGAKRVGEVNGRVLRAQLGGRPWSVAAVGINGGSAAVWGNVLPFREQRVSGCVAFNRERFSSEGDLASYLIWLVENIYAGLPEAERTRFPAFRLADRQVKLEVRLEGYGPMTLAGREGSTLAFRVPDGGRTFLLLPFIVGDDAGRVVVRASYTDGEYFSSAEKVAVGTVVVADDLTATLGDPPFDIRLLSAG